MPNELVVNDRRASAIERSTPVESPSLLGLMERLSANQNMDADKIERLMGIFIDGQRKMHEMEDEAAFAEAMADFKKNPPSIVKARLAKMEKDGRPLYEYNFADLDAYASAAMPGLAERGITWSFPFSENEKGVITVSCILRYRLYTAVPTTLSYPPDATGGKNGIQAKASTISYLERYTFCGATGLTAAMPDLDGKTITAGMSDEDFAFHQANMESAEDVTSLTKFYKLAYKEADKMGDTESIKLIIAIKDKRKAELS